MWQHVIFLSTLMTIACQPLYAGLLNTGNPVTGLPNFGISQQPPGDPDSPVESLGQTFRVPSPTNENVLNSFSFFLIDEEAFSFQSHIFEWNTATNRAVGSSLFTSAPRATDTSGSNASVFSEYAFSTSGIALDASKTYVAFMSTSTTFSSLPTGGPLLARYGVPGGNTYPDGVGVFINNGINTAEWTNNAWQILNDDLAFRASFSAPQVAGVPEPSSLGLLCATALGAGIYYRRRKKADKK